MKSIEIYKTSKNYKICTLYKLESGTYISGRPIFILPSDTEANDLSDKIFDALDSSRNLSVFEEDNYWLGGKLLKELKESSFNKLYKESISCIITKHYQSIIITPRKYAGENQGLDLDENRAMQFILNDNNNQEIVRKINQIFTSFYKSN